MPISPFLRLAYLRSLLGGCVLVLATPICVSAQQTGEVPPNPIRPPGALNLLRAGGGGTTIRAAFRPDGFMEGERVRRGNAHLYTAAERRQLLDGMEEIAIGRFGPPVGDEVLRDIHATFRYIALNLREASPEASEIPGRMLRIYRRTQLPASRGRALRDLGLLLALRPPEAQEIREALFDVATGRTEFSASDGVTALLSGCQAGLPALQRLHREGLMTEPSWDIWFRELAEDGFPLEAMEKARMSAGPCPRGSGG